MVVQVGLTAVIDHSLLAAWFREHMNAPHANIEDPNDTRNGTIAYLVAHGLEEEDAKKIVGHASDPARSAANNSGGPLSFALRLGGPEELVRKANLALQPLLLER